MGLWLFRGAEAAQAEGLLISSPLVILTLNKMVKIAIDLLGFGNSYIFISAKSAQLMRKTITLFLLLALFRLEAKAQSIFEIIPLLTRVYTTSIAYQNCTGYFNPHYTAGVSFVYHPLPSWGLQLSLSGSSPTTYLNDPANNSVAVNTRSTIGIKRLLTGINYSLPLKAVQPFIGGLIGYTIANTTGAYMPSSCTSFTYTWQAGVDFRINRFLGWRLIGSMINIPHVSNNSSYFNVDKAGDGFPSFAVGNASTSNIIQWDIGLGVTFCFGPKMKSK